MGAGLASDHHAENVSNLGKKDDYFAAMGARVASNSSEARTPYKSSVQGYSGNKKNLLVAGKEHSAVRVNSTK